MNPRLDHLLKEITWSDQYSNEALCWLAFAFIALFIYGEIKFKKKQIPKS